MFRGRYVKDYRDAQGQCQAATLPASTTDYLSPWERAARLIIQLQRTQNIRKDVLVSSVIIIRTHLN